jgi:mycothiol synthase
VPSVPGASVRVDVARSLDRATHAEIQALCDEAQEADGSPELSDQARLAVGEDPPPGALVLLARAGASGALAGVASLRENDGAWTVESAVRPDRRDEPESVRGALLDAALAEVAARGGGAVGAWLRTGGTGLAEVFVARGLRPGRELLQLRAPLPPEAVHDASSPPVPVRPFRPGRDEDAWLELNARAFAGHPEQGSWTLADLRRREEEPWFDPGGFLLHEEGDRLAGFCWTKVHRGPVLGEIYVIGVDPDFQGRGLGRALARAGLGHLATRAVPTAMLYVEATNTPALVLYRSLGFTEHHREVQFKGTVAAADQPDAPTARPMP